MQRAICINPGPSGEFNVQALNELFEDGWEVVCVASSTSPALIIILVKE